MVNIYLPDFYYFYKLNITFINLLHEYPDWFSYDIKIAAIYGCFPNQIWNGGRYIGGQSADIDNINLTIKSLNDLGIPIRFTYTNSLLTEEHLSNLVCNVITEIAHNGQNEILVNSSILEDYLREKYPNYKYISSATRCIRNIDELNKLIKSNKYSLVLGDYRDNFDFSFLEKIKQKDKFEILINPWCKQDCKLRELHYKALSRFQLGEEYDFPACECENMHWQDLIESDHIIKNTDLQKYIDMGFNNFKIEGRNMHPVDVIDCYVYYFIKPEFIDRARNILLRAYFERYQD